MLINSLNQLILRKRGVALRVYRDKISKAYMSVASARVSNFAILVSLTFKVLHRRVYLNQEMRWNNFLFEHP